jgi:hypothetical protein
MKGKVRLPINKLQFEIKSGNKIVADKTIKNILVRTWQNEKD